MKTKLSIGSENHSTKLHLDSEDYKYKKTQLGILEGIARGETTILKNHIYSQKEARETMGKWLT